MKLSGFAVIAGEERACGETLVESYDRNQTIRWTERAERLLYERLMQTQFPESCAAAKYAVQTFTPRRVHELVCDILTAKWVSFSRWLLVSMPAYQGLMSDLHYFQVQLVFGMFLGRTVIPLPEIDLNLGDKRHNHAVRPDLYHMGTLALAAQESLDKHPTSTRVGILLLGSIARMTYQGTISTFFPGAPFSRTDW